MFFKYYDKHPIGKVVLHNGEQAAIEDIKVSLFVEQYMDNPKFCKAPVKINPGESQVIELYGLFTDKVLNIPESTVVSAQIVVECLYYGRQEL